MRPVLKTGLRSVWRDTGMLQIGLDPERAVVLSGLDRAAALLDALDGTRDQAGVMRAAETLGLDHDAARRLLRLLTEARALDDAATDVRPLASVPREERERLAPDLAAASLVRGTPDAGVSVLAGRRRAAVQVQGAGRVGAMTAALVAAAGVGHLVVSDDETVRWADLSPGGLSADQVGGRRQQAALAAARRVAPATRSGLPPGRSHPDLVVVTPPRVHDPVLYTALLRTGVPHLAAGVRETTGIVGPLVLPGSSSCLRCHDLHRTDRDPAWPRIAAQLAAPASRGVDACDTALAAAVAAHAALACIAFLDGHTALPVVDGTLEIRLPEGRARRRSWSPHPACGCRWSAGGATTPLAPTGQAGSA